MKKNLISPVGLKGKEINERMKELMGITSINENKSTSVVELTKMGPDGNVYGIVRENHEYYIKVTSKTQNILTEDFKYIGGLQNKKSEAYPSYAKAIKHLNLKFRSLAEAYNYDGEINVFQDDNLLSEGGMAGFSQMKGSGFSGMGNLEGNQSMWSEEMLSEKSSEEARDFIGKEISHLVHDKGYEHNRAVAAALNIAREKGYKVEESWMDESWSMEEVELSEIEKAIEGMYDEGVYEEKEEMTQKEKEFAALAEPKDKITYADKIAGATMNENKLSIAKAIESMDSVIDEVSEALLKKKV